MRLIPVLALALAAVTAGCTANNSTESSAVVSSAALPSTTISTTTSALPSRTVEPVGPVKQEFEYPQANGSYIKVVCSHGPITGSQDKLKYELTASNLGTGTYDLGATKRGGTGNIEPDGSIPLVVMENVGIDEFVAISIDATNFNNSKTPFRYRGCTKV